MMRANHSIQLSGVCSQSFSVRRKALAIKRLEPTPAWASKLAQAIAAQTPDR
jgi:hypothetical protein